MITVLLAISQYTSFVSSFLFFSTIFGFWWQWIHIQFNIFSILDWFFHVLRFNLPIERRNVDICMPNATKNHLKVCCVWKSSIKTLHTGRNPNHCRMRSIQIEVSVGLSYQNSYQWDLKGEWNRFVNITMKWILTNAIYVNFVGIDFRWECIWVQNLPEMNCLNVECAV